MAASSGFTDKLLTGLAGASVTLVPLIINSVVSLLQNRSANRRRDSAIADAKSRVDFLSDWIKAQEQVSSADHLSELKQSTSQELDTIRQSVLTIVHETEPKPPELADRRVLQNLFLLYWPRTIGSWVLHALFYLGAGLLAAIIALYVTGGFSGPDIDAASAFFGFLVFAIPLLLFTIGMQRFARRVDQKENERIKQKLQTTA